MRNLLSMEKNKFLQSKDVDNETENYEVQQIPFLRWIIGNIALKSDSILLKMADYAKNMVMMTLNGMAGLRPRRMYDKFFEYIEDKKELQAFEEFLNYMGVECKRKGLPKDEKINNKNNINSDSSNACSNTGISVCTGILCC